MSEFTRELPSYRLAQTQWGDDLQAVAQRELGDANRWPELVWLNTLVHPYITTDERQSGPSVLLAGSLIKVPAPVGVYTDDASRGQVFERDAQLISKLLDVDEHGDIRVVAGAPNLRQQLVHRVNTPRGQARRHAEYGCLVHLLRGRVTGPSANAMGAEYVKAAVGADYRVSSVESATAETVGDAIKISVRARAIDGGIVDVDLTE